MREKRKNGAECIKGIYKNINLNKIQRSNEGVSQDKESLERHNDSLKNKRSASSLHCSREFWAVNVNRAAKKKHAG